MPMFSIFFISKKNYTSLNANIKRKKTSFFFNIFSDSKNKDRVGWMWYRLGMMGLPYLCHDKPRRGDTHKSRIGFTIPRLKISNI